MLCSMHMGGQVNKMQNHANNHSKWSWNSPIRDPRADRMLMWEWPIACKLIHPVFCACQGDSSFYNNFNKSAVIHADGEAIESWMLSRKTWFCCESTVIQSNRHDAIKCDDVSKLWIENLIRVEPTYTVRKMAYIIHSNGCWDFTCAVFWCSVTSFMAYVNTKKERAWNPNAIFLTV